MWGWGRWGGWGGMETTTTTSSTINVGTISLDLYDVATKEQPQQESLACVDCRLQFWWTLVVSAQRRI